MSDDSQLTKLASDAVLLAKSVPASVIKSLAHTLSSTDQLDWQNSRTRIMSGIAHAHYRGSVLAFLDNWQRNAANVSPQAVSAAVLAASSSEQSHRVGQS